MIKVLPHLKRGEELKLILFLCLSWLEIQWHKSEWVLGGMFFTCITLLSVTVDTWSAWFIFLSGVKELDQDGREAAHEELFHFYFSRYSAAPSRCHRAAKGHSQSHLPFWPRTHVLHSSSVTWFTNLHLLTTPAASRLEKIPEMWTKGRKTEIKQNDLWNQSWKWNLCRVDPARAKQSEWHRSKPTETHGQKGFIQFASPQQHGPKQRLEARQENNDGAFGEEGPWLTSEHFDKLELTSSPADRRMNADSRM